MINIHHMRSFIYELESQNNIVSCRPPHLQVNHSILSHGAAGPPLINLILVALAILSMTATRVEGAFIQREADTPLCDGLLRLVVLFLAISIPNCVDYKIFTSNKGSTFYPAYHVKLLILEGISRIWFGISEGSSRT